MKEEHIFLLAGIAPPLLYLLNIIKTDDPTPVIVISALGFIGYLFLSLALRSIDKEERLINKLSKENGIPKEEFEKIFNTIYHANSGVSCDQRVSATVAHFEKTIKEKL